MGDGIATNPWDGMDFLERLRLIEGEREKAHYQLIKAKAKLRKWKVLSARLHALNILIKALLRIRALSDVTVSRVGVWVIFSVAMACFALILADILRLPLIAEVTSATLIGFLAACSGIFLLRPPDVDIENIIFVNRLRLDQLPDAIDAATANVSGCLQVFSYYDRFHRSLLDQTDARTERLLQSNWKNMRGVEFEEFLADVFKSQEFVVGTTPVTGDQGVDLILKKDSIRIAVQAKGYPLSTVGNSAVQEAFTGRMYYNCQFGIVITNSRFTSSARDAAKKVGCILTDGSEIPKLITQGLSSFVDIE